MADEKPKNLDLLGIEPIAKSFEKVTNSTVDGAAAILSRICLPVAEEIGLLLRDRVRYWRAMNIAKLTVDAEHKINALGIGPDFQAHPRIVYRIIEEGSWTDDEDIQEMWSGLLASSCSPEGQDDSNLIFIQLLTNMSRIQARLLNVACEQAVKKLSASGLIIAEHLEFTLIKLQEITDESDIHRLDREMDHLRSLELIRGGFNLNTVDQVDVTPSALALHMYARCKGFRDSPVEFYNLIPAM
ncbi:MAG: Abi-alpha family protein [Methylomicrobium sp.]